MSLWPYELFGFGLKGPLFLFFALRGRILETFGYGGE